MAKGYQLCIAVLILAVLPAMAFANAQVVSVTSVSGGCLAGPSMQMVELWDVEPGETYKITLAGVTECGNGGTDPTIDVRVNTSEGINYDLVATFVAVGMYEFEFTVPTWATCTMPIFYCTTPGVAYSGYFAWASDGAPFQVHLRASTWEAGCTNPEEIPSEFCTIPTEEATWGAIKSLFE